MVDITKIPPLDWQTPIVDPRSGFPSNQFIRLWQQTFQNSEDINGGLEGKADKTTQIIAGAGLTGGGDLSADRTLAVGAGIGIDVLADSVKLADTAVTPGTYGDATHVPQMTVDQQGRLTAVTNVTITGGGSGTTPAVVQVKTAIGAASTVVLGATPTTGNLLIAFCSHWQNLASFSANWIGIDNVNGTSTDGYAIAMKYVVPGDSATQTPFDAGTGGMSTTVFEVSGALVAIPVARNIRKEVTSSPMAVPLVSPKNGGLLVGMFTQAGSNNAFTLTSGLTLTLHENITGTTANNSPRRSQSISSAGVSLGTAASVTNTFTAGNQVAVIVVLVGS